MDNKFTRMVERNWPAKILSLFAAVLLFLFYRASSLEERFITVPLDLIINEGYAVASNVPSTVKVTLRGSEENVFMILEDDIEIYADFSAHNSEGQFREVLKFRKTGSAEKVEPLEVRIEPDEITVELERKISRFVKIQPQLSGYPEKGWELDQYLLSDENIIIEGPRSHIEQLDFVPTEDISLEGKNQDFYIRAKLKVNDPYLSFPSGDTVGFQGLIKETIILKTFEDIGIIYLDLPQNLYIVGAQASGQIKVQGKQLELEDTTTADFSLIADCSEIMDEGSFDISIQPLVPPGLAVLKYSPEVINIEVKKDDSGD